MPPVGRVVQDQEVADALVQRVGAPIEFARPGVRRRRRASGVGSRRSMSWMRLLDQEQAGGFERLEKAAGETDADAVALPRLRRGDRRGTAAARLCPCALPSSCASNVARASSSLTKRLENTWPLPVRCCSGMRQIQPARLRRGAREWREVGAAFAGHGPGAVAGQPVRPVFPGDCQACRRAAASGSRCSRRRSRPAILLPGLERQRLDITAAPSSATSTTWPSMRVTPRAIAQRRRNSRVEPGIEMIRVAVESRAHDLRVRESRRHCGGRRAPRRNTPRAARGLSPCWRARIQRCWNSTPPQSWPNAPKGCT